MKLIAAIVKEIVAAHPTVDQEIIREILLRQLFPAPELRGSEPVILYFPTATDREQFIRAVRALKPELQCL